MKRSLSDSESEDLYDDNLKASSPSQSCQITDRKKRRGVIEKRRRDRINSSLSELRRLVPSAFEKQGSAKLEKAEILQMTVDHLKMLHQKGLNGYNYPDPHSFATDYRSVGFRECAAEVARYLVAVEGMDLQDPLRLRLLGHLQCFSTQREIVSKSTFQNSWNPVSPHPSINSQYGSSTMSAMGTMGHNGQHNNQSELAMTPQTSHHGISNSAFTDSRLSHSDIQSTSIQGNMSRLTGSGPNIPSHHQMTSMNSSNQQASSSLIPSIPQLHRQLPVSFNMNPMQSVMSQNGANVYDVNSSKPYRPWGSELAY